MAAVASLATLIPLNYLICIIVTHLLFRSLYRPLVRISVIILKLFVLLFLKLCIAYRTNGQMRMLIVIEFLHPDLRIKSLNLIGLELDEAEANECEEDCYDLERQKQPCIQQVSIHWCLLILLI